LGRHFTLERPCALAARNGGAEPFRYQELVELFDVGCRAVAGSYLPALAELYLLTGITEYDNSRPRSVRLYLRDTGLVTALAGGDATAVRDDFDRETALARVAAFDHTMRFAYGIHVAVRASESPSVQCWRGCAGEVDFVSEIAGMLVLIGLAYQSGHYEEVIVVLCESNDEYNRPVGFVLADITIQPAANRGFL
jgi:hypothetical protein